MKIGSARILLVTIRSILSETVKLPGLAFLCTDAETTFVIYLYLWFVIMLSVSSSSSFSQSEICSSKCCFNPVSSLSSSRTFSSLSKILMAYQRRFSLDTIFSIDSSICAIACSTAPVKTWGASAIFFDFATSTAFFISCSPPSFFKALIGTISQPSSLLSLSMSILSPFLRTISIIFSAIITGILSSKSCVVRYRFLSMLVPSIILIIASGLSVTKYFLVTTSSKVYGDSE